MIRLKSLALKSHDIKCLKDFYEKVFETEFTFHDNGKLPSSYQCVTSGGSRLTIIEYTEWEKDTLIKAIDEGIPLRKGHGRIVDIGKIDKDRTDIDNNPVYLTVVNGEYIEAVSLDYLNSLETIVDADETVIDEGYDNYQRVRRRIKDETDC